MFRALFCVALLLSATTRAADPADTDVPFVVQDATTGTESLGPGWWLSNSRMAKVGTRLRDCEDAENELYRLKSTPTLPAPADATVNAPPLLPFGFWAGVVVGVVLSGAAVVAVARLAK